MDEDRVRVDLRSKVLPRGSGTLFRQTSNQLSQYKNEDGGVGDFTSHIHHRHHFVNM